MSSVGVITVIGYVEIHVPLPSHVKLSSKYFLDVDSVGEVGILQC